MIERNYRFWFASDQLLVFDVAFLSSISVFKDVLLRLLFAVFYASSGGQNKVAAFLELMMVENKF